MGFGAVTGHAPLRALLLRAVARDTLPPCLVFAGPAGVGKRRMAQAVAQRLNCEARASGQADPADACGACRACERVQRDVHADVIVVEPGESGTIKVAAIRAVVEQAAYRPFEGRRRVVIIDDADRMVAEAQNALLKTLEEPPAGSVFLLVTSRPHLLLSTVRSRCPALRFGGLSVDEIVGLLVAEHDVERSTAVAAAVVADGSVGRALEVGSEEHLQDRERATEALRALATARTSKQRLETAKALVAAGRGRRSSPAADRETLGRRLRALGALLRDLQLVAVRGEPAWLANADLEADLVGLARAFDADRAGRAFTSVDRALTALSRNASPKVVVDWLSLQL